MGKAYKSELMKKHFIFQFIGILVVLTQGLVVFASESVEAFKIYHQGQSEISLEAALSEVQAGDILILGESHGNQVMPSQQVQVLQELRKQGLKVSVGMEFFEKKDQALVDAMRSGQLSEEDFLNKIKWGSMPYSSYREQVLFPVYPTEYVVALNAPRSLTSRISKVGIAGLTPEELELLPQGFQLGNSAYYRRFQQIMGEHVPEQALARYFEAQSVWDDFMATEAAAFVTRFPDQVLVIIVGEFHVQYGGGLPDRLRQRLQKNLARESRIRTFSLINLEGMSQDERDQTVRPSLVDGNRADWVWTSQF